MPDYKIQNLTDEKFRKIIKEQENVHPNIRAPLKEKVYLNNKGSNCQYSNNLLSIAKGIKSNGASYDLENYGCKINIQPAFISDYTNKY